MKSLVSGSRILDPRRPLFWSSSPIFNPRFLPSSVLYKYMSMCKVRKAGSLTLSQIHHQHCRTASPFNSHKLLFFSVNLKRKEKTRSWRNYQLLTSLVAMTTLCSTIGVRMEWRITWSFFTEFDILGSCYVHMHYPNWLWCTRVIQSHNPAGIYP